MDFETNKVLSLTYLEYLYLAPLKESKEGRKASSEEGRHQGRKNGIKEGRTTPRKEGRHQGRKEGIKEGSNEPRQGRHQGRKEGRHQGRIERTPDTADTHS